MLHRLRRFARFWDLVGNSGNFVETTPLLWGSTDSPFTAFLRWSDWLYARLGRQSAIALPHLAELLFAYLVQEKMLAAPVIAKSFFRDYRRGGRSDMPAFLREYVEKVAEPLPRRSSKAGLKRQARHLAQRTA